MLSALNILALAAYAFVALAHLIPDAVGERGEGVVRPAAITGVVLNGAALVASPWAGVVQPGFPEALSAAALGIMATRPRRIVTSDGTV